MPLGVVGYRMVPVHRALLFALLETSRLDAEQLPAGPALNVHLCVLVGSKLSGVEAFQVERVLKMLSSSRSTFRFNYPPLTLLFNRLLRSKLHLPLV